MIVGEIGIPRYEFLYIINFWEVRRIIRGYNRRKRDMWSAVRWQTFRLMCCWADMKNLKPTDLLKFPWDEENINGGDIPTEEEVAEMKALMAEINKTT